jgi:hypothetical protein
MDRLSWLVMMGVAGIVIRLLDEMNHSKLSSFSSPQTPKSECFSELGGDWLRLDDPKARVSQIYASASLYPRS